MDDGTDSQDSATTGVSRQIKAVNNQIIDMLMTLTNMAEKGPIVVMLAMGSLMIIFSVLFTFGVFGINVTSFTDGKFICLVLSGTFLIIAAASLKFLSYLINSGIFKAQQQLGAELINKAIDSAIKTNERNPPEPFK